MIFNIKVSIITEITLFIRKIFFLFNKMNHIFPYDSPSCIKVFTAGLQ